MRRTPLILFLAFTLDARAEIRLDTHQAAARLRHLASSRRGAGRALAGARRPAGIVFVGTRETGRSTPWSTRRRRPRRGRARLAQGLNEPNGVAFRDGALYVAEIAASCASTASRSELGASAAAGGRLRPLPEGARTTAGSSCASVPTASSTSGRRAVQHLRRDDRLRLHRAHHARRQALESIARGVRNTVGFDWQPGTTELWFTDNGRDWLGDDSPPDELEPRAARRACTSAFPYCHGGDIADPEFGKESSCREFTPPARSSARTSRRSACASTPARCSRRVPARSSSPSTARGTAASGRLPRRAWT